MTQTPLILVVDDEDDVRELLVVNLHRAGFKTIEAPDGETALKAVRESRPDAVILDVMMPAMDGFAVCEKIRSDPKIKSTPVIMLTAKGQPKDRISGLEKGADDYVPKPFSPKELILRLEAILRRRPARDAGSALLEVGPFRFDLAGFRLTVNKEPVELTFVEFKLLHLLAQHQGHVVERDEILQDVWSYGDKVLTRTLDTHVGRVREKLGSAGNWVDTVRGLGYRLRQPEDETV
jgi:two-component system phosphate regulon response regulator PhoB